MPSLYRGGIRIVSYDNQPFSDRVEAGALLADELAEYAGSNTVVLGIPRGGVIIAAEVARSLDSRLDIVLTHKLGYPGNPEFAIGAVTEEGAVVSNGSFLERHGISREYIDRETKYRRQEILKRAERYRAFLPKVPLRGRTVIVTDDGLATGATMQAALMAVAHEQAAACVCAVPVAPEDAIAAVAQYCTSLVCLKAPPRFGAVGEFYRKFGQVEDGTVIAILREFSRSVT